MVKTISRSPFYFAVIGVYIVLCIVLKITSSGIFSLKFFTNRSYSMSPSIDQNSLTVVKKQDSYEVGDVITFYDNGARNEIVTHRVIGIGGNVYKTKGDANVLADDSIVVPRLIIGKVVLIVPYFGLFLSFLKTGIGTFLFVILPAFIFVLLEVRKVIALSIISK